jgi:hypothetical protein
MVTDHAPGASMRGPLLNTAGSVPRWAIGVLGAVKGGLGSVGHAPLRTHQYAAHFQPPLRRLGEAARRKRRRHRLAGPLAPPRPPPQVRTAEMES